MNETESKIKMQENSDLLGENEQLRLKILEMQELNKFKDSVVLGVLEVYIFMKFSKIS